jgi:ubiquinol-cytochrome c reductase cytochrome c1 subunit
MIDASMNRAWNGRRAGTRLATGLAAILATLAFGSAQSLASEAAAGHGAAGVDWQSWKAGNEVGNSASLQRGATNFVNYCIGCHSLKYVRYQRMAEDLKISGDQLRTNLIPTSAKPTDYMLSSMPPVEAEAWFGRVPPDLSLITRAKGADYVYQLLKGFYADPTKATGTDNLALPGAAMPAVLSDLEGVKRAVFAAHDAAASGDGHSAGPVVERFEYVSQGTLKPEEFDEFVRDTTNFLDYVGEPAQVDRNRIGVWVILFLLVFTGLAFLLKREFWKQIR